MIPAGGGMVFQCQSVCPGPPSATGAECEKFAWRPGEHHRRGVTSVCFRPAGATGAGCVQFAWGPRVVIPPGGNRFPMSGELAPNGRAPQARSPVGSPRSRRVGIPAGGGNRSSMSVSLPRPWFRGRRAGEGRGSRGRGTQESRNVPMWEHGNAQMRDYGNVGTRESRNLGTLKENKPENKIENNIEPPPPALRREVARGRGEGENNMKKQIRKQNSKRARGE